MTQIHDGDVLTVHFRQQRASMRFIVVAILFIFSAVSTAYASDTPTLFGGMSIGYAVAGAADHTFGPVQLSPNSNTISGSIGTIYGGGIGASLPFDDVLSFRTRLRGSFMRLDYETTEPTTFNVDGAAVPGTFVHQLSTSWTTMSASLSAVLRIGRHLSFEGGGGIVIPLSASIRDVERIRDPDGVSYLGGGRERIRTEGSIDGLSVRPLAFLRAMTTIDISRRMALEPGLFVSATFGSLIGNAPVSPTELGLSVDIHWNTVVSAPELRRMEYRSETTDTITIIDPYRTGRQDTILVERSRTKTRDSVMTSEGLVMNERVRIVVERHLPSPPPFLSIILDVDVDTVMKATDPDILVRVDVVSDTSIRFVTVDAVVDDSVVWSADATTALGRTLRWPLSSLPEWAKSRSPLTIQVHGVVVDVIGQRQEAMVRRLRITREKVGATWHREE